MATAETIKAADKNFQDTKIPRFSEAREAGCPSNTLLRVNISCASLLGNVIFPSHGDYVRIQPPSQELHDAMKLYAGESVNPSAASRQATFSARLTPRPPHRRGRCI